MDLSTVLVPFLKSGAGSAQATVMPKQYCTYIQDKLEVMYLKKVNPRKWRLVLVVDDTFKFKDQIVRNKRNKSKEAAMRTLNSIRKNIHDPSMLRNL